MATAGASRGSGPERAWAPSVPAEGDVVLDRDESSHLVRSRRVEVGDAVVVFDGRGASLRGRLADADPRAARIRIEGAYPDRRPARTLRMAVALPEMGRADRLVQMLGELGVAELAPLETRRSPPGRTQQAGRRGERWAKLAREACKVSGCARALEIGPVQRISDRLAPSTILLEPDPAAPSLLDLSAEIGDDVWVFVGPEGGFTQDEVSDARAAGVRIARLGATALRVETAAVAAAAVLLAE